MPRPQPSTVPPEGVRGPLADCLVVLAGTPNDSCWITSQLVRIAEFAADLGPVVSHASVTEHRDEAYGSGAARPGVVLAADQSRYAAQADPARNTCRVGGHVVVPDGTTSTRSSPPDEEGIGLRLPASLSIPLFAGRGTSIALLNLYGSDPAPMVSLTAAVRDAYDRDESTTGELADGLERAHAGLVIGLIEAFAVRARIQQAIGVLIAEAPRTPDAAYSRLSSRAAESGVSLPETAAAVIAEHQ